MKKLCDLHGFDNNLSKPGAGEFKESRPEKKKTGVDSMNLAIILQGRGAGAPLWFVGDQAGSSAAHPGRDQLRDRLFAINEPGHTDSGISPLISQPGGCYPVLLVIGYDLP